MRPRYCILTMAALLLATCREPRDLPGSGLSEPPRIPARERTIDLAAFMGTPEEREARAPYSPPGWPLRRGDLISWERREELHREFRPWNDIRAVFWLDTLAFGAHYKTYLPPGAYHPADWKLRYVGHFPQKLSSRIIHEPPGRG